MKQEIMCPYCQQRMEIEAEYLGQDVICPSCNKQFSTAQKQAAVGAIQLPPPKESVIKNMFSKEAIWDFVLFRTMILPKLISIIYVLATLVCIHQFVSGIIESNMAIALLALVAIPVVRIVMEISFVLFSINENANAIKRKLK